MSMLMLIMIFFNIYIICA